MKNTVEKLTDLCANLKKLSGFEASFVSDNAARVEKFGDKTLFSEKQAVLIDSIYQERLIDNKLAKKVV